jgi:hypothetical protein
MVPAGSQVVASLRIYSADFPDAKDIKYTVIGPANDTVFDVTESISSGKELAFRKTFITHPDARSGTYIIKVKIPGLINTAVASDTFEITPGGSPAQSSQTTIFVTPVALASLGSLLLLFIVLSVVTHRRVTALTHVIKKQSQTSDSPDKVDKEK